jgi:hypothetical protein
MQDLSAYCNANCSFATCFGCSLGSGTFVALNTSCQNQASCASAATSLQSLNVPYMTSAYYFSILSLALSIVSSLFTIVEKQFFFTNLFEFVASITVICLLQYSGAQNAIDVLISSGCYSATEQVNYAKLYASFSSSFTLAIIGSVLEFLEPLHMLNSDKTGSKASYKIHPYLAVCSVLSIVICVLEFSELRQTILPLQASLAGLAPSALYVVTENSPCVLFLESAADPPRFYKCSTSDCDLSLLYVNAAQNATSSCATSRFSKRNTFLSIPNLGAMYLHCPNVVLAHHGSLAIGTPNSQVDWREPQSCFSRPVCFGIDCNNLKGECSCIGSGTLILFTLDLITATSNITAALTLPPTVTNADTSSLNVYFQGANWSIQINCYTTPSVGPTAVCGYYSAANGFTSQSMLVNYTTGCQGDVCSLYADSQVIYQASTSGNSFKFGTFTGLFSAHYSDYGDVAEVSCNQVVAQQTTSDTGVVAYELVLLNLADHSYWTWMSEYPALRNSYCTYQGNRTFACATDAPFTSAPLGSPDVLIVVSSASWLSASPGLLLFMFFFDL